jgi:hypothetical protein
MGKIIVRFTTKTRSVSLNDAIKIAEECEHYKEANFYFVHFDEPNNSLQKLLDLIKSWKTTQVFLEDKEVDVKSFSNTFFCQDILLCGGICTHPRIGWMKLSDFLDAIQVEKGIGYAEKYAIQSLTPFLEKIRANKFKLNKDKLIDYIKNEWFFELEHCPIINANETLELVNKFPDEIEVRDRFAAFRDEDMPIGDLGESRGVDEETYKEIAEIFADAFEKRLRKVFKEFYKAKK